MQRTTLHVRRQRWQTQLEKLSARIDQLPKPTQIPLEKQRGEIALQIEQHYGSERSYFAIETYLTLLEKRIHESEQKQKKLSSTNPASVINNPAANNVSNPDVSILACFSCLSGRSKKHSLLMDAIEIEMSRKKTL